MAEEESELEFDRVKEELESLLKTSASDERGLQSKAYCERFCQLVVEQTGRWQVPLPQLQVLGRALCSFVQGTTSFPPDCEHVRYTLSSLALSVFELLLFFGKDEFVEHPLKGILDSFQDCYMNLVRHQNVYLQQVRHIIKDGGPWASPVLQAILKDSELPQENVERYLSSEVSIFFELRVRYLVACERLQEAIVLAKRCSQHSVAGRHLYFMQANLTCLLRASLHERLYKEMADIDGKDAVEILCMAENEQKDETVLMLSKGFLSQQLQRGDMYYLWDLVFIWSRLYLRVNPSKQAFLEECKVMIQSATNLKAIFPFMKVILAELGKIGLGFCVELCAQALQTDLKNDPVTKSLIYKTIAYLLPNDLEVCRACALLVFFLERTVESYKNVFLLYSHPDQQYHADTSLVGNNVRFEILQILKKGLYFDPEFWNLLNIEKNCLKLMSDKVSEAALCEIMQKDKWAPSYCMKGHCQCHSDDTNRTISGVEKPTNRNGQEAEYVKTQTNSASGETSSKPPGKKRGRKPGTHLVKDSEACPVRRSFRQVDLAKDHARQLNSRRQRFLAREAERKTLNRRGRKPQWLLEELAAHAENSVPRQGKKPGRKPKHLNVLMDISVEVPVSEIPMSLSYPDNEVDLFSDVQASTETPHLTESSSEKMKTAEVLKWPSDSAMSLIELISAESTPCSKKDLRVKEELVFREQGLSMVRKFHTYSRVAEYEGIAVDILSSDKEVKPDHNESKQERPLQSSEQQNEPANATQVETVVEIEATQIPGTNLATSAPVEATLGPIEEIIVEQKANAELSSLQAADTKCPDNTVSPEIISVGLPLEVTTLTTADTIPVLDSMPENISSHHEDPPFLTKETTVPDNTLTTCSETQVAAPSEIVPENTEEPVVQQTSEETLQNTNADVDSLVPDLIPSSDGIPQLSLNCSLCNKETKNHWVLRHALWHIRIDRKCMFCHKCYTHGRRPSRHIKLHIEELRKSNGLCKENICKSIAELPETAMQYVQTTLLKRVKHPVQNKFRNIKMRLNCSLEIAQLHKGWDSSESKVRLRTRLAKHSDSTGTLEVRKEKVCRKKRRRLKRVLAGRSQSTDENKKLFRKKLARKRAKTMQAPTPEEDNSKTKGNFVHRINGLIRKRRKKINVIEAQTSLTQDNREHKMENVQCTQICATHSDAKTESENVEIADLNHKDMIGLKTEEKDEEKITLNSGLAKKIIPEDHKEDVIAVKRRKITNSQNDGSKKQEQKEKTTTVKDINAFGQKNWIATKPKQLFTPFQGKETGASTEVKCPVEICMFTAKSILVLSHVLSHHHGDKKALVFFFHFAKEKCLYCSRKIFNLQHFFDHVISHKGELKFPCYHQGCKERYKTRMELSEHMLGHHPLRAVCCFPGCTMQVESITQLYRHEKTHYRLNANLEQNTLPIITERIVPLSQEDGMEVKPESTTNSSKGLLVQRKSPTSATQDDDGKPLVLNRGSAIDSSKNNSLVNGHGDSDKEVPPKPFNAAIKEKEPTEKPTTQKFIRPLPSAYLDESYISMPKRWKEPHMDSKLLGSVSKAVTNSTKQRCSRCFESFSSEKELQSHKDKCTSLFGFDSDDESAS
ncbi:zinc finger protein 654-like isoform X1 [Myxocyprinus asiaticus]|uniref:zinc finger protein 654-like isoform X1 n=2 Tax=Myxocyprinus asiaticus TaxID=70543 RepID=UPI002222D1B5|nr:zinc finger protein 654-like isoform X1 [Myxocyprinus asiaticus]